MVPVPVAALWALAPLLAGADEPAVVTVTAAVGEDTCLPCDPRPWGHLRGVTLTCTHRGGPQHPPTLVLSHRLGQHPLPTEPGWHPPEEPGNRFRGRVAFCGAGATGLGLLLRNVSHPDFGNYSCEAGGGGAPQPLCSLVLQPPEAGVPGAAEPDMIMVVCALTAAFTAVAIGVLVGCRCGRGCGCPKGGSQGPGAADGGGGGGGGRTVALGDLKSPSA
ncbi:unnamed protein product [Bubo scandiacus]